MNPGGVWRAQRAFTAAALILACAGLVVSALLYARGSATRERTQETVCSIGSFLTRAPIIRAQGVSREVFVGQLVTTGEFLRDLRGLDCSHSQLGRAVTAEEIRDQLRRIRRELREERQRRRRHRATGGETADVPESTAAQQRAAPGPVSAQPGGDERDRPRPSRGRGGDHPQPSPEPVEPDLPEHPPPATEPPEHPRPPASVIDRLCERVEQLTRVALPGVCR